jgi:hypothetical protein
MPVVFTPVKVLCGGERKVVGVGNAQKGAEVKVEKVVRG